MKKWIAAVLAALLTLCASPALATGTAVTIEPYQIVVAGQTLQGAAAYREGESVMVPLRKIGEALGYQVGWDADTGAVTVDDGYIQKATLFDGTAAVTFEGRLQVIRMDREIENAAATVIRDGRTYVPAEFFQEFFNDVEIEGNTITIAPSMCEIMEQ